MDDLNELRALRFMPSRIPAQDALEAFIPEGEQPDAEILEVMGRTGASRWYPAEGGYRLLVHYQGGPWRPERFTLRKGAWNHEHCGRCGDRIEPMTLCWVTEVDPYVLLDDQCYRLAFGDAAADLYGDES